MERLDDSMTCSERMIINFRRKELFIYFSSKRFSYTMIDISTSGISNLQYNIVYLGCQLLVSIPQILYVCK